MIAAIAGEQINRAGSVHQMGDGPRRFCGGHPPLRDLLALGGRHAPLRGRPIAETRDVVPNGFPEFIETRPAAGQSRLVEE